jgi:phage shock protein PspC (stress-responsive transcriptional regulator)
MIQFFSFLSIVKPVHAQTQDWEKINPNCTVKGVASIQGIGCLLANVLSVVLTLIGMAGFVMLIYAAFNLLLSAGKSQEVEKSKKTITFAIIGIILALSSFIIINLIANFTGINLIKSFTIPGSQTDWF